ncbi:MAG: hypothetical protein K6G69_10295 [Lachnospiraceae bacterium]|nr:hypothetical protein [Lachnospiraceae bacterium]
MGSGVSGLYIGTHGSHFSVGSLNYMRNDDEFLNSIQKRKDVDPNGYLDIVAHGDVKRISVVYKGKEIELSNKAFVRFLKETGKFSPKQKIRLLSCNTGLIPHSFAQGLADRLHVEVLAPKGYVAVDRSGKYAVYKGRYEKGVLNLYEKTGFKSFYPQGGKQ